MKTYNIPVFTIHNYKEPQPVPVKKEWEYQGLTLFLHRPHNSKIKKYWKVSEKLTGLLASSGEHKTMKSAIHSAHANIDKFIMQHGSTNELIRKSPHIN